MDTKTMFSGGSWSYNSFHTITRNQLVTATSSLKSLFQFAENLGFDYTLEQELFEAIQGQEKYMDVKNFDIHFIQSEILKAFDTNSSFYFQLLDEGYCEFISFANETVAYN